MQNITQNLFFHAILILFSGSTLWFFYTDPSKKAKFSILNHFTDLIFYFALAVFGINVVFHFREILAVPYRALIFSADVVALATFILTIYAGIKYGERLWSQADKAKSVVQLFLFLGLVNHSYLYFIYTSMRSILFIGFFILILGLTSNTKLMSKIDPLVLLLGAGLTHALLMGDRAVLYFNFVFYRMPFLIILSSLTLILFLQRRKLQSNQT